MSTSFENSTDRELRVDLAIYDFHAAVDRGEAPSPAEWVARHPEIAPELEEYFRDLEQLAPPIPSTLPPRTDDVPTCPGVGWPEQSGEVIGDYILLERLGEGGQGVVWKARPRHINNVFVALKTLRKWNEQDEASIRRLRRDAEAIARMKHRNIIKIHFFGQDRGRWYFAMDFMEGGTVASQLKDYKDNPRSAAELMEKVARAIHHAHTRNPGVLHLDLKPDNILLDEDGEPRVTDFGLCARILETFTERVDSSSSGEPDRSFSREEVTAILTEVGIFGTVPYMSPEMAEGRRWDISTASDIYGLGAILYTMLTGKKPFDGRTHPEILAKVIEGKLIPPRDSNWKVDRELQAICLKCLHKDPARRYGSADALANDLGRWLRGEPTQAGGPTVGKHIRFWIRRNPIRVAAACLAVVVLWLAGVAGSLPELQAANREKAARLAREANDKLLMIQRAIILSAQDKDLIESLRQLKDRPDELRRALDTFLAKTAEDYNYRFVLTGCQPLFNLFVLDSKGKDLADTNKDNTEWLDKDFHRRDYFVGLSKLEREAVYVSRVYRSFPDRHYKIAVSRRILDGPECLAVLVVNVAVGSRLVDLDMRREELSGAKLVSPMDWNFWPWHVPPPQRRDPYVVAMDHTYPDAPDADFEPAWLSPEQFPQMPLFERDPNLHDAVDLFHDGAVTNYHRVGETPLVVVLRHPYPWPFSWVLATNVRRSAVPVLVILAFVPVLLVVVRRAALPLPGTGRVRPAKGESGG